MTSGAKGFRSYFFCSRHERKGKTMNITGIAESLQYYLPTSRSRNKRVRRIQKEVPLVIREFASADLPAAFRVRGRVITFLGGDRECPIFHEDDYRVLHGTLYRPARIDTGDHAGEIRTADQLDICVYAPSPRNDAKWDATSFDPERSVVLQPDSVSGQIRKLKEKAEGYILVDGVLYEQAEEPYYEIPPFQDDPEGIHFFISEKKGTELLGDEEFNALEFDLMERLHSHLYKGDQCRITVMPGFESCVRLHRRRESHGYTWSDTRKQYERKTAGTGPVWIVTFVWDQDSIPYYAEVHAANEDAALAAFVRENPDISFSKIRDVRSL